MGDHHAELTSRPDRRYRPRADRSVGRACYRHRWLTLLAWLGGVACPITLWTCYGASAQDNSGGSDPGQALLNQHFQRQSGDTLTLAIRSPAPITSPAVRARGQRGPGDDLVGQRLPWLIGVVVAASMLLLTVMFRSAPIAGKELPGKANWWLPAPLARISLRITSVATPAHQTLGVHHHGRGILV